MNKNFYITTPIYYPSGRPHMGHAYSSIIADFFARFKSIDDYNVHFLTGTDEHGLKIQRSAEKAGKDPKEFCDQISQTFKDLSKTLNLSNTDFIRTTEDRHKKTVQHLWSLLEKNDDIYLSNYSGWYSVSDEAFYNEENETYFIYEYWDSYEQYETYLDWRFNIEEPSFVDKVIPLVKGGEAGMQANYNNKNYNFY